MVDWGWFEKDYPTGLSLPLILSRVRLLCFQQSQWRSQEFNLYSVFRERSTVSEDSCFDVKTDDFIVLKIRAALVELHVLVDIHHGNPSCWFFVGKVISTPFFSNTLLIIYGNWIGWNKENQRCLKIVSPFVSLFVWNPRHSQKERHKSWTTSSVLDIYYRSKHTEIEGWWSIQHLNEYNGPTFPMERTLLRNFKTNNYNEIFQFLIYNVQLCIPLSIHVVKSTVWIWFIILPQDIWTISVFLVDSCESNTTLNSYSLFIIPLSIHAVKSTVWIWSIDTRLMVRSFWLTPQTIWNMYEVTKWNMNGWSKLFSPNSWSW